MRTQLCGVGMWYEYTWWVDGKTYVIIIGAVRVLNLYTCTSTARTGAPLVSCALVKSESLSVYGNRFI